jgi:hypothetical protein
MTKYPETQREHGILKCAVEERAFGGDGIVCSECICTHLWLISLHYFQGSQR